MRVRIISDGNSKSTKVMTESGVDITSYALGVKVQLPVEGVNLAQIEFVMPTVDVLCQAELTDGSLISLPVNELKNLVSALRKDAQLQPQLGRLAWMTVGTIEAAIADHDERVKHVINGGSADGARESEVVQR